MTFRQHRPANWRKPGRGSVRARFELTDDQLMRIRQDLERDGKRAKP